MHNWAIHTTMPPIPTIHSTSNGSSLWHMVKSPTDGHAISCMISTTVVCCSKYIQTTGSFPDLQHVSENSKFLIPLKTNCLPLRWRRSTAILSQSVIWRGVSGSDKCYGMTSGRDIGMMIHGKLFHDFLNTNLLS